MNLCYSPLVSPLICSYEIFCLWFYAKRGALPSLHPSLYPSSPLYRFNPPNPNDSVLSQFAFLGWLAGCDEWWAVGSSRRRATLGSGLAAGPLRGP